MSKFAKQVNISVLAVALLISLGVPAASAKELSELQDMRNSVASEMKSIEARVEGIKEIISDLGIDYQACVASTKVKGSTVTLNSCKPLLEKQNAYKADASELTAMLNSYKEKIAGLDSSIEKYPYPENPTHAGYFYNKKENFDLEVAATYTKYFEGARAAYKAVGIEAEFVVAEPASPEFSNTSDETNDVAIKKYIAAFQDWYENIIGIMKTYVIRNPNGGEDPGIQYDSKEVFNGLVDSYYEKYLSNVKDWMAQLGAKSGFQNNPPGKPSWTDTTDGTNQENYKNFISSLDAWNANEVAALKKLEESLAFKSPSERNQNCLNVYNSFANEINSKMNDLRAIQDLMNKKITVQNWLLKNPASSWAEMQARLLSITGVINDDAARYKEMVENQGKIADLCSGTDSGVVVISKLSERANALANLEEETSQLIKNDWSDLASGPWQENPDSSQTEKFCSEFTATFEPTISSLEADMAKMVEVAGTLSGTDTPENAYFVSNTQQQLIQLKNSTWAIYDKMKRSAANIGKCDTINDLFQRASLITQTADSEFKAISTKWNQMQSENGSSPVECASYFSYYQQRAAGYMDLYRMYAEPWKSYDSMLKFAAEMGITSWESAFEMFSNKMENVGNLVSSDRDEILDGKMKDACSDSKDGALYAAKTLSMFSAQGPLNDMKMSAYMSVKSAFGIYSKTPLIGAPTSEGTQEDVCNATESYYSQLGSSLILSMQNLSGLWSNLDNVRYNQKSSVTTVPSQLESSQNQLKQILMSMTTAANELESGKLAEACKGLSYSEDYQAKIDSLFNPSSGSVAYWYAETKKSINDTYASYKKTLELPSNASETSCKSFTVETLKVTANIRANISALSEKFKMTLASTEMSDATKNLVYQNLGTALLDLQNSMMDAMSQLEESQKSSKCGQISELMKQGSSAMNEMKGIRASMSNVGWNVSTPQNHSMSTIVNAEKTVGADLSAAKVVAIKQRSTIADKVKATVMSTKQTNIALTTNYPSTKITIVAKKKNSSKKLTYQVTTSKTGTATLKARTNLKGYELTIYVGKIAITKSKPIVRV